MGIFGPIVSMKVRSIIEILCLVLLNLNKFMVLYISIKYHGESKIVDTMGIKIREIFQSISTPLHIPFLVLCLYIVLEDFEFFFQCTLPISLACTIFFFNITSMSIARLQAGEILLGGGGGGEE